jgi:hypothetical protein
VRNVRRRHGTHERETVQIVADTVEETLAAADEGRALPSCGM